MGAHERAHFAATRKKLRGPAAPIVPYHRASSIFLAALVGAVSGDAVIFHRERPRGRLQGSAEDLARSLAILDDSIERPRHPFAIEWLMFEHQHRPVAVAQQFQGPRGPRTLEVVLQSVFTRETVKAGRRRGLCDQAQR